MELGNAPTEGLNTLEMAAIQRLIGSMTRCFKAVTSHVGHTQVNDRGGVFVASVNCFGHFHDLE